jgi:hypothetical protein
MKIEAKGEKSWVTLEQSCTDSWNEHKLFSTQLEMKASVINGVNGFTGNSKSSNNLAGRSKENTLKRLLRVEWASLRSGCHQKELKWDCWPKSSILHIKTQTRKVERSLSTFSFPYVFRTRGTQTVGKKRDGNVRLSRYNHFLMLNEKQEDEKRY